MGIGQLQDVLIVRFITGRGMIVMELICKSPESPYSSIYIYLTFRVFCRESTISSLCHVEWLCIIRAQTDVGIIFLTPGNSVNSAEINGFGTIEWIYILVIYHILP